MKRSLNEQPAIYTDLTHPFLYNYQLLKNAGLNLQFACCAFCLPCRGCEQQPKRENLPDKFAPSTHASSRALCHQHSPRSVSRDAISWCASAEVGVDSLRRGGSGLHAHLDVGPNCRPCIRRGDDCIRGERPASGRVLCQAAAAAAGALRAVRRRVRPSHVPAGGLSAEEEVSRFQQAGCPLKKK